MLKIPKHIKVGGMVYKVDEDYYFKERNDRWGSTDHAQNTIVISKIDVNGLERKRENVEETFIHEVLHCIDIVYNNGKLEEDVVGRLSFGIHQVLKDNFLK